MSKLHVKRDDTVIIVSGDDKGKKGKVLQVAPKEGKIIVEGVNIVKKHLKARPPQENGGIVRRRGALLCLQGSAVLLKVPRRATRAKFNVEGDKKTRVCAKCGAEL